MTMGNYEAWSENQICGLRISDTIMQKMLSLCNDAGNVETGGVLVGYYNRGHDCAIVTDVSKASQDSKQYRNTFYRGIKGLQRWLNTLWNRGRKRYYLGEWHFHPFANPTPSKTDIEQLQENANNKSYHCPEPILFIIGGDPNNKWSCKSLVYMEGKISELFKQWENIK